MSLLRPEMNSCFAHRIAVGFLNKAVFFIMCMKQPTTVLAYSPWATLSGVMLLLTLIDCVT